MFPWISHALIHWNGIFHTHAIITHEKHCQIQNIKSMHCCIIKGKLMKGTSSIINSNQIEFIEWHATRVTMYDNNKSSLMCLIWVECQKEFSFFFYCGRLPLDWLTSSKIIRHTWIIMGKYDACAELLYNQCGVFNWLNYLWCCAFVIFAYSRWVSG